MSDLKHTIWAEKYRPVTVAETILPQKLKEEAQGMVSKGHIPHILMAGGAGMGKTTLAKAMCAELGIDLMIINASVENGVETIRSKVMSFGSSMSFSGGKKVTLLDESDALSFNAQQSLRNFMESFASNHSIIFTCNYKNKMMPALQSRSAVFDFKIPNAERPLLSAQFFKRAQEILIEEEVSYDKAVLAEVIKKYFPDFRKCLNELQRYAAGNNTIDSGILLDFTADSFTSLVEMLKAKKFGAMRQWVVQNPDVDSDALFKQFYDTASQHMEQKSIPALVLTLAEYQYKAAFVVNQEINTVAFLTDIMRQPEILWK